MVLNWDLSDNHLDQSDLDAKLDFRSVDIIEREDASETTESVRDMVEGVAGYTSDENPAPYPVGGMDGAGGGFDDDDAADAEVERAVARVRRTYEEEIEIYPGRREVWQIPRPTLFQNTTDREFYALYFPVDIYPLGGQKRYNRIEFGIQLDEEADVDAYDLCPQDVYGSAEVTRTYRLAPTLKFHEVEVSAGDAEWVMKYTKLYPTITVFGAGKSKFGWVYLKGLNDSVPPGSRRNWILLNVPAGLKTVTGTYYSDVLYKQKEWGIWWEKPADADKEFTIDLDTSNTLSERWWETTG